MTKCVVTTKMLSRTNVEQIQDKKTKIITSKISHSLLAMITKRWITLQNLNREFQTQIPPEIKEEICHTTLLPDSYRPVRSFYHFKSPDNPVQLQLLADILISGIKQKGKGLAIPCFPSVVKCLTCML